MGLVLITTTMEKEQILEQLKLDVPEIEHDSENFYLELLTKVNSIEPIKSFNIARTKQKGPNLHENVTIINFNNDINTPINNIIAKVETDLEEYYGEDIDYIQLGEGNQQILIYFAY